MQYILTEEEYKNLVPKEKYEEMKKKAYDLDDKLLELKLQQGDQNTSERKEFNIGEMFHLGLHKLKVNLWKGYCSHCYLNHICRTMDQCKELVGNCRKENREDKTDVIFVKVEENK